MDDKAQARASFRAALPFYINGTLPEGERAEVEAFLALDAEARDELAFAQALAGAARQHVEERDPMAGFDQFQKRLAAARAEEQKPQKRSWRDWAASWGFSPALGFVIALLGLQTVMNLGVVTRPFEEPITRSLATSQRAANLKIVVSANASMAQLVELLQGQRCQIVWGPGSGGEFWLVVDDRKRIEAVRAALLRSNLVDDVLVLEQE
ncbi:hypothetical protein [Massilia brevitalea]|uniref:hypothetical protein n=1 Tax=Massilia brevitalea TaxID=442526 RepID=UPI00273893B6|nr:hypothetical protein [Massilia brevitalea]